MIGSLVNGIRLDPRPYAAALKRAKAVLRARKRKAKAKR